MSKIHILDRITSQSIAAGEVVERPASVVKELVENSLDAGATRVSVYIQNGGKRLIKIVDNGSGMSREDAQLAIQDHATSKITTIDDLNYISSLGFRGEALPTIAAVSRMTLETRREEDAIGTQVVIEGGEVVAVNSVHCNVGTNIEVKDLFYNTPARFKFLKTDQGEASRITDTIQELALGREDVSFYYENAGKEVLHTPGDNKLLSVIYAIFGKNMAKGMTSVIESTSQNGVNVTGYLGLPEISRKSRKWQYFFVNGRSIKSSVLIKAAEDAYKSTLMTQKFPVYVVKINMPSNLVDVNVHPRKLEVRFWNDNELYKTVYSTVQNSLFTALRPASLGLDDAVDAVDAVDNAVNNVDDETKLDSTLGADSLMSEEEVIKSGPELQQSQLEDGGAHFEAVDTQSSPGASADVTDYSIPKIHFDFAGLGRLSREQAKSTEDEASAISEETNSYEPEEQLQDREQIEIIDETGLSDREISRNRFAEARYAGELFKTYLMFETRSDVVIIIDQHAAHEKILFEEAVRDYEENKFVRSQGLLEPVKMPVSTQDELLLEEHPDFLNKYGFEVDSFGPGEVIIRAIPISRDIVDPEQSLRYLIDDALENGVESIANNNDTIYHVLATSACKAAVKAHDILSIEEVEALRKQLLELHNPYHCPHGRPIILEISRKELEKLFQRIVS